MKNFFKNLFILLVAKITAPLGMWTEFAK